MLLRIITCLYMLAIGHTLKHLGRRKIAVLGKTCPRTLSGLSGFSPLSPANLDDIVKKDKMLVENSERLQVIWEDYYKGKATSLGFCLSGEQYSRLSNRIKESPIFIVPVFKEENGSKHIMLLSQMQDKFVSFTYLEEYKQNPDAATQWASLAIYDDFVESKDLALVRGDVSPQLTREEGDQAVRSLLQTYMSEEEYPRFIHAFNHQPTTFNYDAYIAYMQKLIIADHSES